MMKKFTLYFGGDDRVDKVVGVNRADGVNRVNGVNEVETIE